MQFNNEATKSPSQQQQESNNLNNNLSSTNATISTNASDNQIPFSTLIQSLIQQQNVQSLLQQLSPVELKSLELLNLKQQQNASDSGVQNNSAAPVFLIPPVNEVQTEFCASKVEKSHKSGEREAFDSLARIKIEHNCSTGHKESNSM